MEPVTLDRKLMHNNNSLTTNNNNNTNKPTSDLAQIERIQRIVQREILDKKRRLFPDGKWPSDGVKDAENQAEPYTAAMKFGGRDPTNKKKPGMTKRPPNMWMVFRMHAAAVVMADFPEVNQAALTSVLAPIWQNVLTPEEKDRVRKESEKLKEFHRVQFPDWKYRPRQKKKGQVTNSGNQILDRQLLDKSSPLSYTSDPGMHQHGMQMQHYSQGHMSYGTLLSGEDHVDGKLLSIDTNLHYVSASNSNGMPHSQTWSTGTSPFIPISPIMQMHMQRPQSVQLQHVASPSTRMRPASQPDLNDDKDAVLRSILAAPPQTTIFSQSQQNNNSTAQSHSEYHGLSEFLQEPYFSDFVLPNAMELDAYLGNDQLPVLGNAAPRQGCVPTTESANIPVSKPFPVKEEYDYILI